MSSLLNPVDVLVTEKKHAKTVKVVLEQHNLLNKSFRLSQLDQDSFSDFVPVAVAVVGDVGIKESMLWELPSLYIAIPVHCQCIHQILMKKKKNVQEERRGQTFVSSLSVSASASASSSPSVGSSSLRSSSSSLESTIVPLILGCAKQKCSFSSSALGNAPGNRQVIASFSSSFETGKQDMNSKRCHIRDHQIVKHVLFQSLLQYQDNLLITDKERLWTLIETLPTDGTIPQRLEVMGDDRTLVIPNRALNTLVDECFRDFMEQIWKNPVPSDTIDDGGDWKRTLWKMLAEAFRSRRVVRRGAIHPDSKVRESGHVILWMDPEFERTWMSQYGELSVYARGWITITEQGIRQSFDLTKVMFSRGNVSEKIRFGKLVQEGDLVLDLYSGIGYYTLPALVHGKARHVYACEWNPHAISFLRYNLEQNGVSSRANVIEGDCRVRLREERLLDLDFDRVSLGLLPSSEGGWKVAIEALRKDPGGWLHIHGNVLVQERDIWAMWVCRRLSDIYHELYGRDSKDVWVLCNRIERVKSFAPKVDHLVADIFIGTQIPKGMSFETSGCKVGVVGKEGTFIQVHGEVQTPSCALGHGVLHQEWMM
jgi:Predicted methyltransferase